MAVTTTAGAAASSAELLPRLTDTIKTAASTELTFEVQVAKKQLGTQDFTSTKPFSAQGQLWQIWFKVLPRSTTDTQQVLRSWLQLIESDLEPTPSYEVHYKFLCGPDDTSQWCTNTCSELADKGRGRHSAECPAMDSFKASTLLITAHMKVPFSDLQPAYAEKGDMLIELDCGSQLSAHSAFMAHASSVLADAIALAPAPADGGKLRVPVKCVSSNQATLLLQIIYSHRPELWSLRQSMASLQQLAAVAHRLACTDVFTLCDEALVQKCGAAQHPDTQPKVSGKTCLTAANVAHCYALADDLTLPGFTVECAAFLARNFQSVSQELPAGFDPKFKLFLEHFRQAYKYTGKTSAAAASWKAVK